MLVVGLFLVVLSEILLDPTYKFEHGSYTPALMHAFMFNYRQIIWTIARTSSASLAAILVWHFVVAEEKYFSSWRFWQRLTLAVAILSAGAIIVVVGLYGDMRLHSISWYLYVSVVSILVYVSIIRGRAFKLLRHQIFSDMNVIKGIGAALGVGIFLTLGLVTVAPASGIEDTMSDYFARLADNPGGFFAVATGLFTVAGVTITLFQVMEQKTSIVSFGDFINKATALIAETNGNDYVRMLVLTPAMGCLAVRHEVWTALSDEMRKSGARISLTCLDDQAMQEWFDLYLEGISNKKKPEWLGNIEAGMGQVRGIKLQLAETARLHPDQENLEILQGDWKDIGTTYMIANRQKAIVVAPFFLPQPGGPIFREYDLGRMVQMIGFETKDFHAVESVLNEIAVRRDAIKKKRVPHLGRDSHGTSGVLPPPEHLQVQPA